MQRCCCVSFHCHGGEYSNTAMGRSLFDVAANALDFFCAPHWKGHDRSGTLSSTLQSLAMISGTT
jgi:hypothetical protein